MFGKNLYNNFIDSGDNSSVAVLPVLNINLTVLFSSNSIDAIDDSAEIIADSTLSNIKEWIPTGNYVLNACMSGDLFKAVPTGRIVSLCGSSGTGKSFLACSICREA